MPAQYSQEITCIGTSCGCLFLLFPLIPFFLSQYYFKKCQTQWGFNSFMAEVPIPMSSANQWTGFYRFFHHERVSNINRRHSKGSRVFRTLSNIQDGAFYEKHWRLFCKKLSLRYLTEFKIQIYRMCKKIVSRNLCYTRSRDESMEDWTMDKFRQELKSFSNQ